VLVVIIILGKTLARLERLCGRTFSIWSFNIRKQESSAMSNHN
jgi:hypothetical protein